MGFGAFGFAGFARVILVAVGSARWIGSQEIQWRVPSDLVPMLEGPPSAYEENPSTPQLAVSPDGRWLVSGADREVFTWRAPDCVVSAQAASCAAETEPLLLQRFVLPSKLHVLGILDDLHPALATKDHVMIWKFNDSEHVVATLDIPEVLALAVEGNFMLLGCPEGRFHMVKSKYRDDYLDAERYVAMGLPHVIWSFSVTQALSDNYPGNFEITAVALCKGNYWFAVSAWDQSSLTGMTLLWKLHLDISPMNLSTSDGSLTTFFSDISPVRAMRFSPLKNQLIKGCESGVLSFWQHLLTRETKPEGELVLPWPVRSLELSPDANWLVVSNQEGSVRLYRAEYSENIQEAASFTAAPGASAVALSADLGWLLATAKPSKIAAWPLALRRATASFGFAETTSNSIRDILLSPGENYLLTGDLVSNNSSPPVSLWAASDVDADEKPILSLPVKGAFCCMLSVSDDEEPWQVVIGSHHSVNGSVVSELQLWNITGATAVATLQASYAVPNCKVLSLTWLAKSTALIVGCSRKLTVLRIQGTSATTVLIAKLPPLVDVTKLVALDGHSFAFGSSRGDVCIGSTGGVHMDDSRCFYPGGRINSLQLSEDAKVLYSGSSSGSICQLFLDQIEKMNGSCFTQPDTWPENEVLSLALLRESNLLASSSANGWLAVWDLNDVASGNLEPVMKQQTSNYQARIVAGADLTYYYVSGTLGMIQAFFVNSIPMAVRRMRQSQLCQDAAAECSTDWVRSHSQVGIDIPVYLDNLPLQWLSLQSAMVERMGVRPPISLRKVNLSGIVMSNWRSMKFGWWSVPSKIDVRNTTFVQIPVLHGEAVRLVTDANCIQAAQEKEARHSLKFCILRAPQFEGELCASHFVSHEMTTDALAARVMGSSLPILTQIYVDLHDFHPWLCDCPAGTFGPNGSHCEVCPLNHYCPAAGNMRVAMNQEPKPCPPNSGTTRVGLSNVSECQCLPGFFGNSSHAQAPYSCQLCPAASTSGYGSWQCHSCFFGYRPTGVGKGSHGDCMFDWFGVGFFIVLQIAMIQLGLMYWLLVTGLPINDVSKQNGRWVVSTCGWQALWLLPCLKKAYSVSFRKTGNPGLDKHLWDVQTIVGIGQRFVLLGQVEDNGMLAESGWKLKSASTGMTALEHSRQTLESGDLVVDHSSTLSLDTSQGFLHFRSCWVLLCVGRIPEGFKLLVLLLLPWPLWLKAFHQKDWLVLGVAISTAITVILLVLASLLLAPRPAIEANRSNFMHFLPSHPQPLSVASQRTVDVANMSNLVVQFQFFIGSRNAHYVNSNILLSITDSHQLSFAEVIGRSTRRQSSRYFVSHWWGAPFEKSMQSICKHAQLAGGNKWKELAYWCCLFSVNQWRMEDELGNGDLARSSFYLALTDPMTRATLLLLDDEVGCLSRSWCLFEVLQTCLRSPGTTLDRSWSGFEGLLLCTPSGVMNKETGQPGSHVSIDTAILTAQRLVHLRFEDAQATNPADKEMIDIVVGRYVGKQLAMNGLVQHHIREALSSIKEKHNRTFAKLMNELGSSRPSSPAQPSLQWNPPEDESPFPRERRWLTWLFPTDWFGQSEYAASDSDDSSGTE